MSQLKRLPAPYGILIDRDKPLTFSFEGQALTGYAGDTISSALLANNQSLISRSFKYHRPRSSMTSLGHDANTLVQLPSIPNTLGDTKALEANMQINGQNYAGSLQQDRMSLLGNFSRFLPVAFYYKAFYRPRHIWEKWAPLFRQMAGLGKLDPDAAVPRYEKHFAHYDVVVVGGGAAGMAAAISAATESSRVLLVEEQPILGGALNYCRFDSQNKKANELLECLTSQINAAVNITVMTGSICNGWFADNWLPVIHGNKMLKVRAKKLIVCSGVIEQPVVFHNNDLPGIMTVTSAQRLMKLYGVKPGKAAVVLTGDDSGYGAALDLLDAGVSVKAIVDLRESPSGSELSNSTAEKGIPTFHHSTVYAASAKSQHLYSVDVRDITGQGTCAEKGTEITCDLLCMSGGYTPAYQLLCQGGATLSYDDVASTFLIKRLADNVSVAGAVNGVWQIDDVVRDGDVAGRLTVNPETAKGAEDTVDAEPFCKQETVPNCRWPIFPHPNGKEFVDFDEDLQIADILNSVADGYEHIQLVKRYSTVGMGPSQGRHSALATARLVAKKTGRTVAQTGVTTARPPFAPETVGHLAGHDGFVTYRTALHQQHIDSGARMAVSGFWLRPLYYGVDRTESVNNEIDAALSAGVVSDITPLAGIDVFGEQALALLEACFISSVARIDIGQSGLVLQVNGMGAVTAEVLANRISEHHYYLTASAAKLKPLLIALERQNLKLNNEVVIADVTGAWGKVGLYGPDATRALSVLTGKSEGDIAGIATGSHQNIEVANLKCRLFRLAYSVCPCFELHVPHSSLRSLWNMLTTSEMLQLKPVGTEALRYLRLEAGVPVIGQDSEPDSTPESLGLGDFVDLSKPAVIKTRQHMAEITQPFLRQLIAFSAPKSSRSVLKENLLVVDSSDSIIGRVTSAMYSPHHEKVIGFVQILHTYCQQNTLAVKTESSQIVLIKLENRKIATSVEQVEVSA